LISGGLLACDGSPSAPERITFSLFSINDRQLPAPYPDLHSSATIVEVVSGTLKLYSNETFDEEYSIRCMPSLPPGTTCQVTGDGRVRAHGTYSRAEAWIDYTEQGPLLDYRFRTTFDDERVIIDLLYPPSVGFAFGRFKLEYRR
jgi:hypothetical protein